MDGIPGGSRQRGIRLHRRGCWEGRRRGPYRLVGEMLCPFSAAWERQSRCEFARRRWWDGDAERQRRAQRGRRGGRFSRLSSEPPTASPRCLLSSCLGQVGFLCSAMFPGSDDVPRNTLRQRLAPSPKGIIVPYLPPDLRSPPLSGH